MDLSRRINEPEIMDGETLPERDLREALAFLAMTNRFFGGETVVLRRFERWSRRWKPGESIRVLDVGSGGADIPAALSRWAARRGFDLRVTALELILETAAIARENIRALSAVEVRQDDFFRLAEGDESFDYVTASLFLHHCAPEDAPRVLRAFDRLARRGVIVSDLLRSRAGYWAVKALSRLAGNRVVRHDGPLSVRRAFRLEELAALARESGLPYLAARREPWFRVSLCGEKI
ncbi:MAG: methyltransferase domain-containing protein [Elusimicrobiota bacterium]